MTKIGIFALIFSILYSIVIGVVCYQLGKRATEYTAATFSREVVAESIPSPENSPTPVETNYIIREFNNRIGVYENDELIRIVNVDLSTFRAEDLKKLNEGIEAKTKEEVAQILEDFSS